MRTGTQARDEGTTWRDGETSRAVHAPFRCRRGFSLIELMIVLTVLAIMTAMVLPAMKGTFEDALLRSTGRQLAGALNLAHSQTITRNERHRLRIDTGAGRYFVERAVRDAQGRTFAPLRELPGAEGALDTRIAIQVRKASDEIPPGNFGPPPVFTMDDPDVRAGQNTILFYPDGTVERAEILLRDREGFGLTLRIHPVTARVRIVPVNRE